MATPLKYYYNDAFFAKFMTAMEAVLPDFKQADCMAQIYSDEWEALELKQRMRHIAKVLHGFLPEEYPKAIDKIIELVAYITEHQPGYAFEYMFIPDFVEVYGMDDYETSIMAMEKITQYSSCEFAVRPYLIKYQNRLMKQMLIWSTHEHQNVRRFATEGCRPRLPWAMALPALKKDPSSILPILENLKDDSSEFVRKSVANNLNDISKDNPEVVIKIAHQWIGQSSNTDWVVKHGCRTLLKQGNTEVMSLFGFGSVKHIKVDNLKIENKEVTIGGELAFTFNLINNNIQDTLIRLEYAVYYQKANGTLSKKIYKISEKTYADKSISSIHKKQSFRLITTRRFHKGLHQLAVVVNGVEYPTSDFVLV